jgi:hypothetical protein
MHEQVTHYICCHVSIRRILAARLLGVCVVSPKWVLQCQEVNTKANEDEFALTSELVELISSIEGSCDEVVPVMSESATRLAEALRMLESPMLTSQRESTGRTESQSQTAGRVAVNQNSNNSDHNHTAGNNSVQLHIPLPSFREITLPKPDEVAMQRRRSERICDLESSSDSEDDIDVTSERVRRVTTVRDISTTSQLPILYRHSAKFSEHALSKFEQSLTERDEEEEEEEYERGGRSRTRNSNNSHHNSTRQQGSSDSDTLTSTYPQPRRGRPPKNKAQGKESNTNSRQRHKKNSQSLKKRKIEKGSSGSSTRNRDKQSQHGSVINSSNAKHSTTVSSSSSNHMVIALTGFERRSGDLETMRQVVLQLIAQTSGQNGQIVSLLEDDDDPAADFTHLIVSKKCQL